MSELWKKWEGQVVDHKYQLLSFLGSTDHSVVFLCEFHDPGPQQAAIKFISAEVADRERQIADWKQASELTHPNLLLIYGAGICRIDDTELLYIVLEYAEENLSQVLPQRALVTEEAHEMLRAITSVLVYLHQKNLTHGHIKPSNVLAIGESLKISSDTILAVDEIREMRRERTPYDPPELPGAPYTAAADVWALGVTLVEAFTQQPAVLPFNEQADPIIPSTVRAPFLEVARNTLRRDPSLRWSSAQIAEYLNPKAVPASAKSVAAGVAVSAVVGRASSGSSSVAAVAAPVPASAEPAVISPLEVPLSKEPAIPLSKQGPVVPTRSSVPRPIPLEHAVKEPETVVLPNYVIPLFAALFIVIALIVLPFAFHRHTTPEVSSANSPASTNPVTQGASSGTNAPVVMKPPATKPVPETSATNPATTPAHTPTAAPESIAPSSRKEERSEAKSHENANAASDQGTALDQVMPKPSARALSTIHGAVKVGVKVHVDPAGAVTQATLENAGPSRYFADLALKAAQQWAFTPPEVDGRSVASDWLIQFQYTPAGVKANSWALGANP
jgi:TonB family protein